MNRKLMLGMLVLFGLMSLGGRAVAESGRKMKFFGQIETWSTADAFDAAKDANKAVVEDPLSPYFESSEKVDAGMGGRIGALSPIGENGFFLGESIGFIKGPKGTFTVSDGNSPSDNNARVEDKTSFLRIMAEARKHFSINKVLGLRLGAGIGLAMGKIEETFSAFSSPLTFSGSSSDEWTGLTWEITPSILFKAGETNIELGVTYAAFPTLSENDNFYKFKWNPFGLHLGVEF